MASDFWIVLQWWGTLFLVGAAAWPLTKKLFAGWFDHGYLFSKAVGIATVTWIVYVMGTIKVMPFSVASIGVALGVMFVVGIWFHKGDKGDRGNWRRILLEEAFFFGALLFWSWIKGHEPSIRGLEKFMDYGFMQSILNSRYFPPADMWYAGSPINYYYFGHMVVAVLTKLSGLDLSYTFNLMLATIFAFTITMSFSIGFQLSHMSLMGHMSRMRNIATGMMTAFLVALAGNMQTIYAFTRGYTGENVKPFWELGWGTPLRQASLPAWQGFVGQVGELWGKIGEGMNTYWYANATRFIPFTIHEFPSYSFVVSDVHGHVLSIPFVLLAIGLLIHLWGSKGDKGSLGNVIFYGFLVGVLLMTNALDGPIYLGLFLLLLAVHKGDKGDWGKKGIAALVVMLPAVITSLPFLIHFKSFVTGLAVNCPPSFLANTKFGPIMFEGVEKCQVSPLWMWWLLWGFFVYCGGWLFGRRIRGIRGMREIRVETLLIIFFAVALGLVVFPELFYFKDIYPAHFRSNTMFKLGYQAFILFSIVSGYVIIKAIREKRKFFLILLLPQLFLVSIFPIFSVRSYFGGLKNYEGIEGLGWMRREYTDDWAGIEWMNGQEAINNKQFARFAIVEADGDSYTDHARFSAFTGMPTIIGWPVHEWLWRGSYDVVAPRREEVRLVYESKDIEATRMTLVTYGVRYIIVGTLERRKYPNLQEWKFGQLGYEVFRSGQTVVYEVK